MPYEIRNKLRGPSTIRLTGIDTTGALALSAFSANVNTENVNSIQITSMKWSVLPSTGTITITRDALVVATLYQNGEWIHNEVPLSNTATGTLTVAIVGGGTIFMTVNKDATYNVDTQKL